MCMSCGFSVAFLDAVFELGFLFVLFFLYIVCVCAHLCVCVNIRSAKLQPHRFYQSIKGPVLSSESGCEPVWPSGKALGW